MRRTNSRGIRCAFVGAIALLALLGTDGVAHADNQNAESMSSGAMDSLRVFGVTNDSRLVFFRAGSPRSPREVGSIVGLSGGDTALIGIDFRVQDGLLYGVGNNGGVYTIDSTTAVARLVNVLTVPLSGTFFGVDFNPAADIAVALNQ
jgi:hypothetical protein